ncbi:UNVERIFIED_CONTAM: hypothetical protein FKN15_020672 [Acipenser sinensis]
MLSDRSWGFSSAHLLRNQPLATLNVSKVTHSGTPYAKDRTFFSRFLGVAIPSRHDRTLYRDVQVALRDHEIKLSFQNGRFC